MNLKQAGKCSAAIWHEERNESGARLVNFDFFFTFANVNYMKIENNMGTQINERQADIINLNVGGTR